MKTGCFIAIGIAVISFTAQAIDGHNGIKFDMTKKQVEEKGFFCNPPKRPDPLVIAECHHMDMTGVAFGIPAKDYEVRIGTSNRVDEIKAELIGLRSLSDVIELHQKIEKLFPTKDEAGTHSEKGMYTRDEWRAKDNSGVSLFMASAIPPITKAVARLTFYSPRSMEEIDKVRAERAKKPSTKSGEHKAQ